MGTTARVTRVQSIDILRGAVMVLMAIDHVRVYSGLPAGGPTPGIFFTRWITNFVAPAFAFLAGTGAYLLGRKLADRRALSRFLVTRGLWLVLLAGLIWLPLPAIAAFGLIMIVGHNLMDLIPQATVQSLLQGASGWFWHLLYFGGFIGLGPNGPTLAVLYVIVPWIGVMAAGYAFGTVMTREPAERRRLCLMIGWAAIVLFLVLRGVDLYGDPRHWHSGPGDPRPALFRFLNTAKYPASLLFLLMTLGPTIALLPWADTARGPVARMLETFGRVPFFFYLLHIPLIHALALVVSAVREGSVNPWLFTNHPMMPPDVPEGYTWSLPLLYLVFALAIVLLYPACRWYARLKAGSSSRWLSYL